MVYRDPPRYGLRLVSPPTEEPVTLEEAMDQLNIAYDQRHMDGWLNRNIPAAREWCEGYLGRALAPQTLVLSFGGLLQSTSVPTYWQPLALNPWVDSGNFIALPMGPVVSVEITYYDENGDLQTLDEEDFEFDGGADVPTISLLSGAPTVYARRDAIQIRYVAGYTFPDDSPSPYPLPASLHSAILVKLQHLEGGSLDDRLEVAAKSLMEQYRLRLGMA